MKEVKFRAWHTTKKIMYTPEELGRDDMTISADGKGFLNVSGVHPRLTQPMPWLLPMQYIGRKDSKGQKIYKGDILSDGFRNGPVEWDEEVNAWAWQGGIDWGMIEPYDVEVIGNIYENPIKEVT